MLNAAVFYIPRPTEVQLMTQAELDARRLRESPARCTTTIVLPDPGSIRMSKRPPPGGGPPNPPRSGPEGTAAATLYGSDEKG